MDSKDRDRVENILAALVLALNVALGIFLVIVLFRSGTYV